MDGEGAQRGLDFDAKGRACYYMFTYRLSDTLDKRIHQRRAWSEESGVRSQRSELGVISQQQWAFIALLRLYETANLVFAIACYYLLHQQCPLNSKQKNKFFRLPQTSVLSLLVPSTAPSA